MSITRILWAEVGGQRAARFFLFLLLFLNCVSFFSFFLPSFFVVVFTFYQHGHAQRYPLMNFSLERLCGGKPAASALLLTRMIPH